MHDHHLRVAVRRIAYLVFAAVLFSQSAIAAPPKGVPAPSWRQSDERCLFENHLCATRFASVLPSNSLN